MVSLAKLMSERNKAQKTQPSQTSVVPQPVRGLPAQPVDYTDPSTIPIYQQDPSGFGDVGPVSDSQSVSVPPPYSNIQQGAYTILPESPQIPQNMLPFGAGWSESGQKKSAAGPADGGYNLPASYWWDVMQGKIPNAQQNMIDYAKTLPWEAGMGNYQIPTSAQQLSDLGLSTQDVTTPRQSFQLGPRTRTLLGYDPERVVYDPNLTDPSWNRDWTVPQLEGVSYAGAPGPTFQQPLNEPVGPGQGGISDSQQPLNEPVGPGQGGAGNLKETGPGWTQNYETNLPPVTPEDVTSQFQQIIQQMYNPKGRDDPQVQVPGATDLEAGERVSTGDDVLDMILQEYQDSYVRGQAANEARYGDIMNALGGTMQAMVGQQGVYPQMMKNWEAAAGDYENMMGASLANRYNTAVSYKNADQSDLWRQRMEDITGQYTGLGEQQRQDMLNRYEADQARQQQELASRGLGNTTVSGTMARGLGREREADMRRLEEDLRRESLGAQTQLSGDWLSAKERGTSELLGLQNDYSRQQAEYAQDLLGVRQAGVGQQQQYGERYASLVGDYVNQMNARTDEYPALSELANLFLQTQKGEGGAEIIPAGEKKDRTPISTGSNWTIPQYTPRPLSGGGQPAAQVTTQKSSGYSPYGS